MRIVAAALVATSLVFTVASCDPPKEKKPVPSKTEEDTSDEVTLQFHNFGTPQYGAWYEPVDANSACTWRVEGRKRNGDVTILERGNETERVRVRAEVPNVSVFLIYVRACGHFEESK